MYINIYTYIYRFFTNGYVYAIELRNIGCLFSFSYASTAIVYSPLAEVKNEFATNENGIHISPKIESVLMNIYMQSSIHG